MGNKPFSYERIFGVRAKTSEEVYQDFCRGYVAKLDNVPVSSDYVPSDIRSAEKSLFALTDLVMK